MSAKYEKAHSKWFHKLDRFGLAFFYEKRSLFRVFLFTLLCTVAAFIYMIEDYQQCTTKFMGLTKSAGARTLEGFQVNSGLKYYGVDVKMRGMFNPNIQDTSAMNESLFVSFCNKIGIYYTKRP